MKKQVDFFETIKCRICPHNCIIKEGYSGLCRVREVKDGILYVNNYGEISALAVDPIEKKPLFHYKPETHYVSVEDMIKKAKEYKSQGSIGLEFTYNEPLMFYEYVLDVAKRCKEENLDVVVVTNGFINKEPLEKLLTFVDAMNIDLKSFSDEFYKTECSGSLENVMSTIELASKHCHVEVTTLLITGYNDTEKEVRSIASFIANIDKSIPLHLSRYYPNYKFEVEETDIEKIKSLANIAKEYLNYAYIGNVLEVDNNTYCPSCDELIIERNVYDAVDINLGDICGSCGEKLYITHKKRLFQNEWV